MLTISRKKLQFDSTYVSTKNLKVLPIAMQIAHKALTTLVEKKILIKIIVFLKAKSELVKMNEWVVIISQPLLKF